MLILRDGCSRGYGSPNRRIQFACIGIPMRRGLSNQPLRAPVANHRTR